MLTVLRAHHHSAGASAALIRVPRTDTPYNMDYLLKMEERLYKTIALRCDSLIYA